jgi:steroid delta-isomerase-like uncharacterized protein
MGTAGVPARWDARSFIEDYFRAWEGTDENRILSYYSDAVTFVIPGIVMQGKADLRDQFVRPFVAAFPGNRHVIKNMVCDQGLVVVEWSFEANHSGPFVDQAPTGVAVKVPGVGFYECDPTHRQITSARIYIDIATLLRQISSRQPKVLQDLLMSWFAARTMSEPRGSASH